MSIQEALDLTGLKTLWAKIKQYITAKLEHKPDIYTSTSEPTSSDGNDGDLWLVYENPSV